MLGFKRFETAAITIAGIELLRGIHKGQFNLRRLRLKGRSPPAIWNAVLTAQPLVVLPLCYCITSRRHAGMDV